MDFDWSVIAGALPALLKGAQLTVLITVAGLAGGTLLGVLFGLMRAYGNGPVASIGFAYVGLVRGTPIVVQVMFIYFALPGLLGVRVDPMTAAIASIVINSGAYIAEIVRGGFKAVGKGQMEAALSLGLSPWRVFTLVRLPLALRAMLPILANQYVWLMKATTMGIAVGFTDFFMIVALTINHSGQTLEVIGILMAGFLAINLSLAAVFNRINKAIALKGNQLRG